MAGYFTDLPNMALNLFGTGKHGYKDTVPPTAPLAKTYNMFYREINNAVELLGGTLNVNQDNQLGTAIKSYVDNNTSSGLTSRVQTLENQMGAKANINSPTLTGFPRAPTPSSSDNSTRMATTQYVRNQGYATFSVVNTKANINSPTLTGIPRAPTPSASDSSTRMATTAFVKNQGYASVSSLNSKANITSPTLSGVPRSTTPPDSDDSTRIATTAYVKNVAPSVLRVKRIVEGSSAFDLRRVPIFNPNSTFYIRRYMSHTIRVSWNRDKYVYAYKGDAGVAYTGSGTVLQVPNSFSLQSLRSAAVRIVQDNGVAILCTTSDLKVQKFNLNSIGSIVTQNFSSISNDTAMAVSKSMEMFDVNTAIHVAMRSSSNTGSYRIFKVEGSAPTVTSINITNSGVGQHYIDSFEDKFIHANQYQAKVYSAGVLQRTWTINTSHGEIVDASMIFTKGGVAESIVCAIITNKGWVYYAAGLSTAPTAFDTGLPDSIYYQVAMLGNMFFAVRDRLTISAFSPNDNPTVPDFRFRCQNVGLKNVERFYTMGDSSFSPRVAIAGEREMVSGGHLLVSNWLS